ncbi:hypothetical protein CR159_16600 [Pollutimonas subterranea]|uniref:tRNA 5-methylaminomethyl-2-thiouridine biosynthesis bifunctional protein MnmC n=1 Tax=Pollutimonas subterranea TaxID=2045210 RepID=A0A2N4U185_9BURK|nr:FAD-dependent 5-carboxymethylaminomethyl-2-thiouridine(34) oxidoreductase MnmC [Pollutimonas subterranea]PLC48760.1 hypothetical protein CR159_16600 [Pollutimonas subterranea]
MSDNYEALIPARIAFNEQGVPLSAVFGDVYHPQWGALEQAARVFLHGNRLPERWRAKETFTVCETGFGLGNNFLALWQAWRGDPCRSKRLHVIAFEAHPFTREDLRSVLMNSVPEPERALASQLIDAWPPLLPGLHQLEFEGGKLTLTLAFGTVARLARQASACVDAFFLDGFAPKVNPDMWTRALFGQLVRMANAGATVATWCCTGEVRRGLRDAGFLVSKVPGHGGKREITVATLRPGMGRQCSPCPPQDDVLVIGGGLAGAGVAYALATRGHDVTVMDPVFAQGLGASHQGHIAAAITPVISRDDDIRARLSRAGVARALHRWQGLGGEARPLRCGTIELVPDSANAAIRRESLERLRFPGDWVRWMDGAEASERAGTRVDSGGLWFADGQRAQPQALIEALLSHSRIRCMVGEASSLRRDNAIGWVAMDSRGNALASAGQVVVANAARAVDLLSVVPGIAPRPKFEAMYRLAGQVSVYSETHVESPRVVLAGDGYCLPAQHASFVGGSTYLLDAETCEVTPEGHAEINKKVAGLLNVIPSRLARSSQSGDGWAGWRAAVADRLPVIGHIDEAPGLWLACAYGSRGLSWASLAGDIIGATLNQEPLPLERELLRSISPR